MNQAGDVLATGNRVHKEPQHKVREELNMQDTKEVVEYALGRMNALKRMIALHKPATVTPGAPAPFQQQYLQDRTVAPARGVMGTLVSLVWNNGDITEEEELANISTAEIRQILLERKDCYNRAKVLSEQIQGLLAMADVVEQSVSNDVTTYQKGLKGIEANRHEVCKVANQLLDEKSQLREALGDQIQQKNKALYDKMMQDQEGTAFSEGLIEYVQTLEAELQSTIRQLNTREKELRQANEKHGLEYGALSGLNRQLERDADELRHQLTVLQKKLNEQIAENGFVSDSQQSLQHDNACLRKQLAQSQYEVLDQQKGQEKATRELRSKLSEHNEYASRLHQSNKALSSELQTAQRQCRQLEFNKTQLAQQVAQLNRQVEESQQLEAECKKLQRTNTLSQSLQKLHLSQIREAEKEKFALEQEILAVNDRQWAAEKELREANKALNVQKKKTEAHVNRYRSAKAEKDKSDKILEEMTTQVAQLKHQLQASSIETKRLKAERLEMEKRLTHQNTLLSKRLEETGGEKVAVDVANTLLKQELEEKLTEVRQEQLMNRQLADSMKSIERRMKKQGRAVKAQQREAEQISRAKAALELENQQLLQQLDKLKVSLNELHSREEDHKERALESSLLVGELKSQVSDLKEQKKKAEQRAGELRSAKSQLAGMQNELDRITRQEEDARSQLEAQKKTVAHQRALLRNNSSEYERLQTELEMLKKNQSQPATASDDSRLKELEQQYVAVKAELAVMKRTEQQQIERLNDSYLQRKELEIQKQNMLTEKTELQSRVDELAKQAKEMKQSVKEKESELAGWLEKQREFEETQKKCHALQQKNTELESRINQVGKDSSVQQQTMREELEASQSELLALKKTLQEQEDANLALQLECNKAKLDRSKIIDQVFSRQDQGSDPSGLCSLSVATGPMSLSLARGLDNKPLMSLTSGRMTGQGAADSLPKDYLAELEAMALQLEQAKEINQQLKEENCQIEALRQEIFDDSKMISRQLHNKEDEAARFKSRCRELGAEKSEIEKQNESLQQQLAELEGKVRLEKQHQIKVQSRLEEEKSLLQERLDEAEQFAQATADKNMTLTQRTNHAETRAAALESSLDQMTEELAEKEQLNAKMQGAVVNMVAELRKRFTSAEDQQFINNQLMAVASSFAGNKS